MSASSSRPEIVEFEAVDGPLDSRRLAWVAALYGDVDPKYRRSEFLEHLFVRGPAGPALHAFAVAGATAVGHAAVVPTPARRGDSALRAGKLEALVVSESHRGARGGPVPVARTLLDRLYTRTDERGIELLHAYVLPRVGRATGFTRIDGIGRASLVSLLHRPGDGATSVRRRTLAGLQLALHGSVRAALRLSRPDARRAVVRPLSLDDADLLDVPPLPAGRWAVVANGAFDWYAASPHIRVLELSGSCRSRLLVQLPASPLQPLRIAGSRSERPGVRTAALGLAAAARLARDAGAATLRLQGPQTDPHTRGAAYALGFVPRRDLTTLWVRAADASLARRDAVIPTPMLYLGF